MKRKTTEESMGLPFGRRDLLRAAAAGVVAAAAGVVAAAAAAGTLVEPDLSP
jgi:hypothetical protein